jgi:hypothetical protein
MHYKLVNRVPVLTYIDDPEWQAAWHIEGRIVEKTWLGDGVIEVSTVFLPIDYGLPGDDRPIVFETMVFKDDDAWENDDIGTRRYSTWEEAEEGHWQTVEAIRELPWAKQ